MMGMLNDMPLRRDSRDGAYDIVDCREAVHDQGGRQVILPEEARKRADAGMDTRMKGKRRSDSTYPRTWP
jgi:hypothetical protein